MTCPSLLHRREVADLVGDPSDGQEPQGHATDLLDWLRSDATLAQFARFVLVGAVTTVIYAVLFLAARSQGTLPAHLFATAISTLIANEMHRRLTFRAEERVHWFTAQWEAGGVTVIGLLATSTALGWLSATEDAVPPLLQIALVVAVTGLVGLLRFIALRWIFRGGEQPAAGVA